MWRVLLLGLAACGDFSGWGFPPGGRPVPVYLSPTLPVACQESTFAALDFWVEHGVDYLEPTDDIKTVIQYGILIVHRDLPNNSIGTAARLPGGVVLITLEVCGGAEGLQVAAHEFGHALSLDHVDDPTNLMHPYMARGGTNLALTEEQLESVR